MLSRWRCRAASSARPGARSSAEAERRHARERGESARPRRAPRRPCPTEKSRAIGRQKPPHTMDAGRPAAPRYHASHQPAPVHSASRCGSVAMGSSARRTRRPTIMAGIERALPAQGRPERRGGAGGLVVVAGQRPHRGRPPPTGCFSSRAEAPSPALTSRALPDLAVPQAQSLRPRGGDRDGLLLAGLAALLYQLQDAPASSPRTNHVRVLDVQHEADVGQPLLLARAVDIVQHQHVQRREVAGTRPPPCSAQPALVGVEARMRPNSNSDSAGAGPRGEMRRGDDGSEIRGAARAFGHGCRWFDL